MQFQLIEEDTSGCVMNERAHKLMGNSILWLNQKNDSFFVKRVWVKGGCEYNNSYIHPHTLALTLTFIYSHPYPLTPSPSLSSSVRSEH